MANDASDHISYFLLIDKGDLDYLGHIRHWSDVKFGSDERGHWVKDLDYAQVYSSEIQTIPQKRLYAERDERLFPLGSLLPEGRVPNLLWTPIDRAISVKLPSLNHNYFGLSDSLEIKLVSSETEAKTAAVLVSLFNLEAYIETAPAIRLKNLMWTVVNQQSALVFGTPLLPVSGKAFWQNGIFLLPAGFDFELHSLADHLVTSLDPAFGERILWYEDATFIRINSNSVEPLSISSFRSTFTMLKTTVF